MAPGRKPRSGRVLRRDGAPHRRDAHGRCRGDDRRRGAGDRQGFAAADSRHSCGPRAGDLASHPRATRASRFDQRRLAGRGRADADVAHPLVFRLMKRVLIVEDKESLALMLKETVESEGLEADVVANGNDAMRRLAEGRRYFAVLTDLRLPGADGIAVLKQARESDPDCPVIVLTGFATIENAVEAMKIGAYDFVQKPVDVDHLLLLLRRCRENGELRYGNIRLK